MKILEYKTDEKALQAILKAASRKPTEDEIRKQRISWVFGQIGRKSKITKDELKKILDSCEGRLVTL